MFYKEVCYRDNENSLFVYKVPLRLTNEQIEVFLKSKNHSMIDGEWFDVKSIKRERSMNKLQFVKMFPSDSQLEMITKINKYFTAYESRQQNYVQMKSIACKMLYEKGLMYEHIRDVMGYKNHASIVHLANYRCDLWDYSYEQENFWQIIDEGLYPVYDSKNVGKKVKWVKLHEIHKY